ncbi:sortase [Cellulomonas hominis]
MAEPPDRGPTTSSRRKHTHDSAAPRDGRDGGGGRAEPSYRVDQILTVDPTDVASLVIEDDEDYVTLITCTPIGVNSHRLLVRGVRVEEPPSTGSTDGIIAGGPTSVEFPSWAVAFVGGSLAFAFVPRLGAGLRTWSDDRRDRHRKGAAGRGDARG